MSSIFAKPNITCHSTKMWTTYCAWNSNEGILNYIPIIFRAKFLFSYFACVIVKTQQWSMFIHWEKKAIPCPAGSSTVLFYLPNLFPPNLALHCPGLSLLCSLATLYYRISSSLGLINACCHPVAKTKMGLLRTLICLFGHDGTHIQPTHHYRLFCYFLASPWAFLPCHTHFILHLLSMQYVCACVLLQSCCCGFLYPKGHRCECLYRNI